MEKDGTLGMDCVWGPLSPAKPGEPEAEKMGWIWVGIGNRAAELELPVRTNPTSEVLLDLAGQSKMKEGAVSWERPQHKRP